MATEQLVVFQLVNEEYAVPISQVKEIICYGGATKLPRTPAYMEGIINLRGKVIPVIDMAGKFRLATEKQSNQQAMIVETSGKEIGLVVDAVTEVIRLEDTAIEVANGLVHSNESIRAIGKTANRLLIILDLAKIFTQEEMELLNNAG